MASLLNYFRAGTNASCDGPSQPGRISPEPARTNDTQFPYEGNDDLPPPYDEPRYTVDERSRTPLPSDHLLMAKRRDCVAAEGDFYDTGTKISRHVQDKTEFTKVRFHAVPPSRAFVMMFPEGDGVDPVESHIAVTGRSDNGGIIQKGTAVLDLGRTTRGVAAQTADGKPSGWFAYGVKSENHQDTGLGLFVHGNPPCSDNEDGTKTIMTQRDIS